MKKRLTKTVTKREIDEAIRFVVGQQERGMLSEVKSRQVIRFLTAGYVRVFAANEIMPKMRKITRKIGVSFQKALTSRTT